MTKTQLERGIIARQTEAEFAAEVSRLKRANDKIAEAASDQIAASYWAREARERLCSLVHGVEF